MNNTDTPANKLISTIYKMGDINPDNSEEVIIDNCVMVKLMIYGESEKDVGIVNIEAVEPGKGQGSIVMGIIVETADELGVNLWIDIIRRGLVKMNFSNH